MAPFYDPFADYSGSLDRARDFSANELANLPQGGPRRRPYPQGHLLRDFFRQFGLFGGQPAPQPIQANAIPYPPPPPRQGSWGPWMGNERTWRAGLAPPAM